MKTHLLGALLAAMLTINGHGAFGVDETKPYGRVTVTVLNLKERTEVPLSGSVKPGAEQTVITHLEANAECEAVVAAFSKPNGSLVNGWLPVLQVLDEPFGEKTVPADNEPWAWTHDSEPFEVFAVFLPKGAAGTAKLRDLVAKLRQPEALTTNPALAKLQAKQLREELLKWAVNDSATTALPESAPEKIGGTVRAGAEFAWRDQARKIGFSETKPTVTVFRHAGK